MTAGTERIKGEVDVGADVRAVENMRRSMGDLNKGMGTLAKGAIGLAAAFTAASRLGDFLSAIQNADNLIRTATDSTTEMIGVKRDLIDIASSTRTSFSRWRRAISGIPPPPMRSASPRRRRCDSPSNCQR